jgi:hypothetical protein
MTTTSSFRFPRFYRALYLVFAVLLSVSCTSHIGYGRINWSIPEESLSAGDVVPVYIQSNISKVYVIGVGKGFSKHLEVPLWKLTLYKSKSAAKKAALDLGEYRYIYATVKKDGLPIHSDPDSTSKDVYRLKEGQTIKILKKGTGTPVLAGKDPLQGDWLEVLTDDGSIGWCFSYNLALYDEREQNAAPQTVASTGPDATLDNLLSRAWYPDSLRTMLADNRVDISRINPAWGFFPGNDTGIARIENADGILTFPYTSISRADDGTYSFVGSALTVQVRRVDAICVQHTDANGMPQALYFASLDTTPADIIKTEQERRDGLITAVQRAGPRYSSGSYGVLQFLDDNKFLWSGYQLLVPAIIPSGAGSGGRVDVGYFLSDSLVSNYEGVLTFTFDATKTKASFLYNRTPDGLKLEYVSESNIKDSIVLSQNINQTVVFFTPAKSGQGDQ